MTSEIKSVVVTGGASGIGFDIAGVLHARGWQVHLLDLKRESLDAACDKLGIPHDRGHNANVVDEDAVDALLQSVAQHAQLGAVVNCAGIGQDTPAIDMTVEDFRRIIDVNLTGTFIVARAAARYWLANTLPGAIVNIGSVSGLTGNKGRASYGSSKAAVSHLTRILCTEWGSDNIRINTVAPGAVNTPLTDLHHTPDVRQQWHERIPQKRYGTTREIANAVAFLISDEASYINGQTLAVDGGFTTAGLMVRE
ncbi:SDR family oxidoreductase [Tianweitania sp. BSSL-BM11]|uniref:SDR family oxidoreductase n=1 Tax=Tianweitania aestuarii TaxID=2814886 RepID=A0ABS5S0Y2_9HYPH|nr:SDR family NAD(P)-dependent oxidoreductase [Tianweitania aestuarii]MBS9722191.1 SDR family oxidoreductase [Tianweitania aestuarii]